MQVDLYIFDGLDRTGKTTAFNTLRKSIKDKDVPNSLFLEESAMKVINAHGRSSISSLKELSLEKFQTEIAENEFEKTHAAVEFYKKKIIEGVDKIIIAFDRTVFCNLPYFKVEKKWGYLGNEQNKHFKEQSITEDIFEMFAQLEKTENYLANFISMLVDDDKKGWIVLKPHLELRYEQFTKPRFDVYKRHTPIEWKIYYDTLWRLILEQYDKIFHILPENYAVGFHY